jgi:hypothetical protein
VKLADYGKTNKLADEVETADGGTRIQPGIKPGAAFGGNQI